VVRDALHAEAPSGAFDDALWASLAAKAPLHRIGELRLSA
jgi:hypothetical protein